MHDGAAKGGGCVQVVVEDEVIIVDNAVDGGANRGVVEMVTDSLDALRSLADGTLEADQVQAKEQMDAELKALADADSQLKRLLLADMKWRD